MTDVRLAELTDLQQRLGVEFRDLDNLALALRHRSSTLLTGLESNERLEFLGDSVLGVCVCEQLYRSFPHLPEGDMAKAKAWLVSEPVLAQTALSLKLDVAIELSSAENNAGGRHRASILSDVFESVVAAIFLDRGMRAARHFVRGALADAFAQVSRNEHKTDYKSGLQEWTQALYRCTPEYRIVGTEGRDHDRTFTAEVWLKGRLLGAGSGNSKKSAEQQAAQQALTNLEPGTELGEEPHTDEQ